MTAQITSKQVDSDSLPSSEQLIIVLTDNWETLQGRLHAFEKKNSQWEPVFSNAIVVGSKGLGIGKGVVEISIAQAPEKKEGDKKSPAGIFRLGKAFGYASAKEASWLHYPYIHSGDTVVCVDDPSSRNYNRIISADSAIRDYQSFEHMRLKSNAYKWGVFVEHNYPQTKPGLGSCIFLHVWDSPEEGTVGCTAMKEDHMVRILKWLDEKKNPLLVQMTEAAYRKIALVYGFPGLE